MTHHPLAKIQSLKTTENRTIADIVQELQIIDERNLYQGESYSSLYAFCTIGLGYSEGAAMRRINAARLLRTEPSIYRHLQDGKLSLCVISEIMKVVDPERRKELLDKALGRSKREVQRMAAPYLPPEKEKRETVRVRNRIVAPPPPSLMPLFEASPNTPSVPAKATKIGYFLTLSVEESFMKLLEEAKSFTGPVQISAILEEALRAFVAKKKSPPRRRSKKQDSHTRYISKSVRHAVFERDGYQCSYKNSEGVRCSETQGLELDHIQPFAVGGATTEENLRVLCKGHNQWRGETTFGKQCIENHRHHLQLRKEKREAAQIAQSKSSAP